MYQHCSVLHPQSPYLSFCSSSSSSTTTAGGLEAETNVNLLMSFTFLIKAKRNFVSNKDLLQLSSKVPIVSSLASTMYMFQCNSFQNINRHLRGNSQHYRYPALQAHKSDLEYLLDIIIVWC